MNTRVVILVTQTMIHAAALRREYRRWVIEESAQASCDAPHTIDESTDLTNLAESVVSAAKDLKADEIDLILPASWCFVHRVSLPGKKLSAQAVEFALEEFVPVAIEKLTCTFLAIDPKTVLAVAVLTEPIRHVMDAVAEHGIQVRRILVDALVIQSTISDSVGVMLRDGQRASFVIGDRVRTVFCHDESLDVQQRISHSIAKTESDEWKAIALDESNFETSSSAERPADEILLAAADTSQLDLRVGDLASDHRYALLFRQLTRCAVLAAMLFVFFIVRELLASRHLRGELDQLKTLQARVFTEVFPGRPAPSAPALILASERKRLAGLTQSQTDAPANKEKDEEPALLLSELKAFVASLPEDLRIQLNEANLDGQQISLRGRTTDHREAERIAEALRQVPRIECGQPRTSRLPDGGVEFSVRGKHAEVLVNTQRGR